MRFRVGIAVLLLALVGGCDKAGEKKGATQVAAQVNGDEITVHQVNNVLVRTRNVTADVAPRVKREILDRLINQQLARQQALEKKLDRTPTVVQAIESAKNEILARAYFEQVVAAQPKPTTEEAKQYFIDHPELFSQRKVFHVEEIVARSDNSLLPALSEQVARTRSMQAIVAWLKGRNAQFAQTERIVAAEEVPLSGLRALRAAKEGEIQINETPNGVSVYRVISAKSAPIDEATAIPRIQQFLLAQRSNEAVAKEVKRMRDSASIEYLGEFASENGKQEQGQAQAPALPSQDAPDSETSGFDKGLRGLK